MAKNCSGWYWHLCSASWLAIGGAIATSGDRVLAQITPDGTLGAENSVVTPTNINGLITNQIDGGAVRGANLFHSFEQFSVPTGGAAYFNNALDIQNIISRVTGGSVSNIDGLIRAHGTANLFLLNPNGIIFGPNTSLNIGGSFVASTASHLKFADGRQFSATATQATPLLTVNVPTGLQFGQVPPGKIVVQGDPSQPLSRTLQGLPRTPGSTREVIQAGNDLVFNLLRRPRGLYVLPGKTLALVGGNLEISSGNLTTEGGRIELGSVVGPGLVNLTPTVKGWALSYEGVEGTDDSAGLFYGDIQLSKLASLASIKVTDSNEIGGDIQVQGSRVTLLDDSAIFSITRGSQDSAAIYIRAEQFNIGNGSIVVTATLNSGNSGNLTIEADSLTIRDSALIGTVTAGQGNAGALTARAASVSIINDGFMLTGSVGSGTSGELIVNTQRLSIWNGGELSNITSGGRGRPLQVIASESVEVMDYDSGIYTDTFSLFSAGDLTIITPKLTVNDGAQISASTFGKGPAGNLVITASDFVELRGTSANGDTPSGLFAASKLPGYDSFQPTGRGGDLNIIIPTGQLIIRNGAQVSVGGLSTGNAGDLKIAARTIQLDNKGAIVAETTSGEGGNITLQLQDLLLLRRESKISTTAGVTGTGGNGGNITIDTPFIVAVPDENSNIIANAYEGNGGKIDITASGIFGTQFREQESPESSDITASSDFGLDGVVEINTPEVDPSQGIVALPAELVDASGLIASGCGSSRRQGESKFIVTGRGGLPIRPGDADLSPYPTGTVRSIPSSSLSSDSPRNEVPGSDSSSNPTTRVPTQIVEATGWVINKGQLVLVAQAPTPTIDIPWLPLATCHTP